ncbi:MAG: cytochrome c biogenesis protein CcdA [Methanobacteriota archaeon]|nr:MAG: cytochrome c biogenesis protein CcdA [Euryarchaeota archaeon]
MITEFVVALYLGVATSFSPCLFPVLPSFLAFLTGGDTNRGRGIFTAIAVSLGILTVFLFLGLILDFFNEVVTDFFNPNYVNFRFFQGLLLVIFGLMYSFNKNLGSGFFSNLSDRVQSFLTKVENPWITAYLIGIFFSVLAAPCAIILFVTFFTLLIATPTLVAKISLSLTFSLGIGIPFLLMGALIPSIKETLDDSKDKLFRYMPYVTGTIISLTGVYLMVDAVFLGFDPTNLV